MIQSQCLQYGGFPKIRGTILGVRIIRAIVFGLYIGVPFLGNYNIMPSGRQVGSKQAYRTSSSLIPCEKSSKCSQGFAHKTLYGIMKASQQMAKTHDSSNLDHCQGSFRLFGVWGSLYLYEKDPLFFLG